MNGQEKHMKNIAWKQFEITSVQVVSGEGYVQLVKVKVDIPGRKES